MKKYLVEFSLYALMIMVICAGAVFGLDKELARRDYEKAVRNNDYERPIVGCIFEYNCEHYTNILWK